MSPITVQCCLCGESVPEDLALTVVRLTGASGNVCSWRCARENKEQGQAVLAGTRTEVFLEEMYPPTEIVISTDR